MNILPPSAKPLPSKFFGSDSDTEEEEPVSARIDDTPVTRACGVIATIADNSLTPNSRQILNGLDGLKGKKDTPKSREKGVAVKKLGKALNEALFGDDNATKFSTPLIQSAHDQLRGNGDLQRAVVQVRAFDAQVKHKLSPCLSLVNVPYYNMEHILHGDKAGGMHYATPKHPQLKNIQYSLTSHKVFCGTIKDKFSTFFNADHMTTTDLRNLLMNPKRKIVAKDGDRVLFKSFDEPFFIESYERNGIATSAYPIFFHAFYSPNMQFQVSKDLVLESHQVLNTAVSLILKHGIQERGPIKYYIPNGESSMFVVDIAPALGMKSGIYFFIPSEALMIAKGIEPILSNFALPNS